MYIDIHAHYEDRQFKKDADKLLQSMPQNNVSVIINAASSACSAKKSLQFAEQYDFVYACCGIHPHEATDHAQMLPKIEPMLLHQKCVAVGEIGLDYFYDHAERDQQLQCFEKQMALAKKADLPVVIHNRDAFLDCLSMIRRPEFQDVKGVFHCFTNGADAARRVLDCGYYLSIGGVVTFKNARKVVETVKMLPLDRLLTETDSPYLSPEPHRGKRNDSTHIPHIVSKIAQIKNIDRSLVIEAVYENMKRIFPKIDL